MTALGTVLLASGLGGWAWMRLSSDPVSRGRSAYARGDWESAAGLARQGLRAKAGGEDAEALRLLARSTVRLGRYLAAIAFYQRLGPPAMQVDDLHLLGIALTRTGSTRGGLEVWERARSADPDHAETLYELTRAYYANDRLEDAVQTGRRLAARPGWAARAEALLGKIQLAREDPEGAVAFWRRAVEHQEAGWGAGSQPVVSRKDLTRALLQAGQPAEARRQLQAARDGGADPEAAWLLGRAAMQEGDWALARAAWEQASSFRDENPLMVEPAAFVGTEACVQCHDKIKHSQQGSRHARTFFRGSELGDLELPAPSFRDPPQPEVTHTLRRVDGSRLQQETRAEGKVLRAVVEYAFGSGDRGMTLIGRDDRGQSRELRLSYYPNATGSSWDVTSGHFEHPDDVETYLGRPLTEDAVRRCFLCHVTDPKAAIEASGPGAADRGIGCEKCHGPGGNHLIAVQAKLPDLAIARPGLARGTRVVMLCAQCHSPRGKNVSHDDPTSIRFQGTTLTWSRCFTESGDGIDCVTCHDPHRDVQKSTASYEARCLSCHAGAARPDGPTAGPGRTGPAEASKPATCPVNPGKGCIGCHMPAVTGVIPHTFFTDHFIRVHRD
jgi:tetratricopeptide (TPR) repeat protein